MKKLLPVTALILGLITALVWCAGPCCPSMGASASALSIGAIPCCGGGTPSRCQASIQRAESLAAAPDAAPLAPPAILANHAATPAVSTLKPVFAPRLATLPRPDLFRLAAPLLI